MKQRSVLLSLATEGSDFQREQAKAAEEAAERLGLSIQIIYAQNDALTQSEQLLKVIQGSPDEHPQAIVMQPCGQTALPHVARAAAAAGIGWVVLNWAVDYIADLRREFQVPVFIVSSDQKEIGRIQGQQAAALLPEGGSVLYLQGPGNSPATRLRNEGFLLTKPVNIQVRALRSEGWTEEDGRRSVGAWIRLATSHRERTDAVIAQSDLLALGAKSALQRRNSGAESNLSAVLPFTGVDGLSRGGQNWVRQGRLAATVIVPTNAGTALEMLAHAFASGSQPQEITFTTPASFPAVDALNTAETKALR